MWKLGCRLLPRREGTYGANHKNRHHQTRLTGLECLIGWKLFTQRKNLRQCWPISLVKLNTLPDLFPLVHSLNTNRALTMYKELEILKERKGRQHVLFQKLMRVQPSVKEATQQLQKWCEDASLAAFGSGCYRAWRVFNSHDRYCYQHEPCCPRLQLILSWFYSFIWLCQVLVVARGILSLQCGMEDPFFKIIF